MTKPHTLVHQLLGWGEATPDRPALYKKKGSGWETWSWARYVEEVRALARGLQSLGHEVGDCVAIVGNNRPEWSICQMAIMANRGAPAPIYTTLTWEQVAYIVDHSQSKIAICDTKEQLDKYLTAIERGEAKHVEHIVTMDDLGVSDARVVTFDELLKRGRERDEAELDKRIAELTVDETALLIYTSGTTGRPKAVQLEHGGMLMMSSSCIDRVPFYREPGVYRAISYLPLCHVAEQLFTTMFHMDTGGEVYYCPDLTQLKDYLVEVRPTLFSGVPRVWEKFQAALQAKLAAASGVKGKLSKWALAKELESFRADTKRGVRADGIGRKMANQLVISKIKTALGLENVLVAGTGAAPISLGTLEFFASLGIMITEGYGMSETTGLATLGELDNPRFGSVGRPLDGVEIRIADDDEILLKGRNMTRGYLRQDEQTKELIDDDGWLHTGDLGSLDDEGFLRITGRKKDLLITAGGKNVAPSEMEGYIKSIVGVSQAVVVGDGKPYLSALVVLDSEVTEELAKCAGTSAGTVETMSKDAKVHDWIMAQVESGCNTKVARYQTIKMIDILPTEFTVDSGEITPTMKVKRNVVNERFAAEIAAMYESSSTARTASQT